MQPHRRAGFIALFVLLLLGSVRTDEKNSKWWHDNLSGPDSSNYVDLDQIKKSNVDDMEVAWTYPYAAGGFNPIVVDDTVYVSSMGEGDGKRGPGHRSRCLCLRAHDPSGSVPAAERDDDIATLAAREIEVGDVAHAHLLPARQR